jgi:hypothetical protein
VALLAPISLHLGSRHPLHADRVESIAHILELEGFDDGDDDLHARNPAALRPGPAIDAGSDKHFMESKRVPIDRKADKYLQIKMIQDPARTEDGAQDLIIMHTKSSNVDV